MTFPKGLIKAKLFDDEKSSELLKVISRIESLISDFGFDGLFEELTRVVCVNTLWLSSN